MKKQLLLLTLGFWLALGSGAQAAMRVDIYGPGQNIVNLALAAPLKGPQAEASGMGSDLQKIVQQNLSFLPFMRLTDPKAVLGGVVLAGYEPPSLDFKRFQLAGSDIVVTTYWPEGDSGTRPVQIRAFETNTGGRLFGKEYPKVTAHDLPEVADRFCAELGAQTAFYATGDLPRSIREACRTPIHYRETLITDGLHRIWLRNRKG